MVRSCLGQMTLKTPYELVGMMGILWVVVQFAQSRVLRAQLGLIMQSSLAQKTDVSVNKDSVATVL